MRKLFAAAALGLGLLSAGSAIGTATAAPYNALSSVGMSQAATPVRYEHRGYHRPHYVPPPRHHWRRHTPPPPRHHSWRHPRPYQYGSRY